MGVGVFKTSGSGSGLVFFSGLISEFYLIKNLDLWMENFANFKPKEKIQLHKHLPMADLQQ